MRASLGFSLFVLGLVSAGCSGKVLDVGSSDAGSATGPIDVTPPSPGRDASAPAPAFPADHGPPYDASIVAAAKAACAGPHGELDPAPTVGDLRAKLVGAWYFCSTNTPSEDTVTSMEFAPDGHWYNLVDDGAGRLVRAHGIDQEGTYDVTDQQDQADASPDAGTSGYVPRRVGAGTQPDFPEFERDPRRMQITVGTAAFVEWFVYLGPSAS